MRMIFFIALFVPQLLHAGSIPDYQPKILALAQKSYSPQVVSRELTELYDVLENDLEKMTIDISADFDPEQLGYNLSLITVLGPFAAENLEDGKLTMDCEAYQNFLIVLYKQPWDDMPEEVVDCWQLIKRVCQNPTNISQPDEP